MPEECKICGGIVGDCPCTTRPSTPPYLRPFTITEAICADPEEKRLFTIFDANKERVASQMTKGGAEIVRAALNILFKAQENKDGES